MKFKRAKNEHVYSKGPLLINSNNEDNIGCFLRYLHNDYENILLRYMEEVLEGNNEIMLPPSENLKYIINNLDTEDLRNNILKKTIKTKDYSPFYSTFPYEDLGPNEKKRVLEIQDFIKKYFNTNILVGNTYIKYNDNQNLDYDFFNKQKIEFIVLLRKNSCEIHKLKKANVEKMKELYKYLSVQYPNTWHLSKDNRIIKVKNFRNYQNFDKKIIEILNK